MKCKKPKVLFLCTGNSCRSQMAEGWARHLKGDEIEAFSAGIETHGLNLLAVEVMAEAGVDISGHSSKTVADLPVTDFDYVITVCGRAHETCPVFPGKAKVIHVGFDDPPKLAEGAKSEEDALAHYRRVRDEIRAFVEGLPERLASKEASITKEAKGLWVFERYLPLWVGLCILAGIILGKVALGVAKSLDGMAIYVGEAPVVSIPIAVCLFFMMYPIMVRIDFPKVLKAGKSVRPVGLTLFVNWAVKPFTMYGISLLFLGVLFKGLIGPEAVDCVKMPFGLDLAVGETYGAGTVVMMDGLKMLEVPLWRSYLAGCILLGNGLARQNGRVFELVNQSVDRGPARSDVADRLADLNDQIVSLENREAVLREELATAESQSLDEEEVASLLSAFGPIWQSLPPRDQIRIIRLIVDRVDFDGRDRTVRVVFRSTGLMRLCQEFGETGEEEEA